MMKDVGPPNPVDAGPREPWASLPREIDPPAAIERSLLSALRNEGFFSDARRGHSFQRAAAAAAVLFLAFGSGYFVGVGGARGSEPSALPSQRYLLLLYGPPAAQDPSRQALLEAERFAEYSRWAAELAARNRLIAAEELAPVEGTERALASEPSGFFLLTAESPEEADAIARSCPHLRHGGTVSLRAAVRR